MAAKKASRPGYGKLLDAWIPPEEAGRPVGCVATSFTFDPVFFEEECLGRFLSLETNANEDGPLYLIEREEKLSQVVCASVLVDRHHCRGTRSLRWDLIPAPVTRGIMHAKISLLHWSNLIRLIVASANLTEDGYRRNQEVFGVLDYRPDGDAPVECLLEMVGFLKQAAAMGQVRPETTTPAMNRWTDFLDGVEKALSDWGISDNSVGWKGVRVFPILVGPDRPNGLDSCEKVWPNMRRPPESARVISPFFNPPESENQPAKQMWELIRRRGNASVSYYITAEEMEGSDKLFLHAPETLRLAQPDGRRGVRTSFNRVDVTPEKIPRPLHAKGIWLENDYWVLYMIGSSNFTSAGLGIAVNPNLEANLAYCIDRNRNPGLLKQLANGFIDGVEIAIDERVMWQPQDESGEDSPSEEVPLPAAFGEAVYHFHEDQAAEVALNFTGRPPAGWHVRDEADEILLYGEDRWIKKGKPSTVVMPWTSKRPPSGFIVGWSDTNGRAWWPVNARSASSLPPPQELKNLPLDVLIEVLTSARPLAIVMKRYLHRGALEIPPPAIDPHKRVDTSGFLLQRTRRISWALNALRERLERPAATMECLNWRLRGPLGVTALAEALIRESEGAGSDEERSFLISELILELSRVKPQEAPGCLSAGEVEEEIGKLLLELKELVPWRNLKRSNSLRRYLKDVFTAATK